MVRQILFACVLITVFMFMVLCFILLNTYKVSKHFKHITGQPPLYFDDLKTRMGEQMRRWQRDSSMSEYVVVWPTLRFNSFPSNGKTNERLCLNFVTPVLYSLTGSDAPSRGLNTVTLQSYF